MKDKEKQVKEMYQAFLDYKEATLCKVFTYKGMCENFINLGYTRISEDLVVLTQEEYTTLKLIENYHIKSCGKNSVVLSMEEFDEFRKDQAEVKFLKNQITDQARKATAEKIFNKIKIKVLTEDMTEDRPQTLYRFTSFDIMKMAREIVEEFGVGFENGHATVEIKE